MKFFAQLRLTPPALATGLLLAACATTPTHFYTLLPPATSTPAAQSAAFQIEVLPVDVPAQVDTQQLVVREGNGVLTPVSTRRWIAPLPSELRLALVAALAQRLGVTEVSGVAVNPALPLYRIQLSVRRFDSALGDSARIEAVWTLRATRDSTLALTCESRAEVAVAPGYEALAEGHQRALMQIADAIARTLLAVSSGNAACAGLERVTG